MTIFRFTLMRAFRSPLNLLLVCVLPVGAAFLPAVEDWLVPIGFQMYGAILLFGAFLLLRSVVEDGVSGVFQRLGAAPITQLRYLWETLLAYALILFVQNAVMVCLGVIVHGKRIPSPFLLFIAYSAFSLTSLAISLAGGALFRNRDTAYQALSTLLMVIAMIGGFFWPLDIMPPSLRRAAMATPCYWLVHAIETLKMDGPSGQFVLSLAVMLLFAIAFLLVGSRRRMA
jgi:ABC-2 type transport system permease protein